MRKYAVWLLAAIFFMPSCACASEDFTVPAKAAVLIDAASGQVLFGQNENEMLPEASCTKIMTALLALENTTLGEEVTAGSNASGVTGTSLYLSEGETLTMEQMLYGIMLRSGNDAAVAVAEHIAGSVSAFADMMNRRAEELNADAHYVNPHGLDAEGHKASALGLARIMRQALTMDEFRTITSTKRKIIPWVGNEYSRVLENKNRLLTSYEGTTGGKTGFTSKAGRCLVFSAERNGLELIGTVLNCPTWFDTAESMLDYGFRNFYLYSALNEGEIACPVTVYDGERASVDAVAEGRLAAASATGIKPELILETDAAAAPVEKGQVLGTAYLRINGQVIAKTRLLAAESVEKWDLAAAFKRIFRNLFSHPSASKPSR